MLRHSPFAIRHERLATLAANAGCRHAGHWASPPCSRWRRDARRGGPRRPMAPRLASPMVAAEPKCGARYPPIWRESRRAEKANRVTQEWMFCVHRALAIGPVDRDIVGRKPGAEMLHATMCDRLWLGRLWSLPDLRICHWNDFSGVRSGLFPQIRAVGVQDGSGLRNGNSWRLPDRRRRYPVITAGSPRLAPGCARCIPRSGAHTRASTQRRDGLLELAFVRFPLAQHLATNLVCTAAAAHRRPPGLSAPNRAASVRTCGK